MTDTLHCPNTNCRQKILKKIKGKEKLISNCKDIHTFLLSLTV